MRIALAAPLYAPDFAGGVVQVVRRLARGALEAGHEVGVLAGRAVEGEPEGAVAEDEVDGVRVWRVNVGGALAPFAQDGFRSAGGRIGAEVFLEAFRPDVLHVHGLQGLGVGVLEEAAARGVPIVATLHDWWWSCPCLFRLSPDDRLCPAVPREGGCPQAPPAAAPARVRTLAAARELIDRVLVPGRGLREEMIDAGWPAERVVLSPNGTPGALAAPGPGGEGSELVVGFFGGAGNREKGLADLARAAAELPPGVCRFLLFGVDPHEPALADAATPPGVPDPQSWQPRASFPPEQLGAVLAELDLLVVPSRMRESFSLVTHEAMAAGVPVLATDCGGPEEVIVDGVNGQIVPTGDTTALAAALVELARDREQVVRMGQAALRTAAELPSIDDQVRDTLAVWRSVVAERIRSRLPKRRREVEGLRVLFLSGIDEGPLRYRVHNVAESLAALGAHSRVLFHADPQVAGAVRHADVLVLFRTPWGESVRSAVGEARRRGLRVVYSVDDLLVPASASASAPAMAHRDPSVAGGFAAAAASAERAARACDALVASTPAIADAAESLGIPAFVLGNQLGEPQLAAARRVRPQVPGARADEGALRRVGFFSGTDTHDDDLAMIAEPLAAALETNADLRLVLGGPLRVPATLERHAAQIERVPLLGWSDLPAELARLDLHLSPLRSDSAFNAAKSDVKFLEAALLGVPTLGSPSPALVAGSHDGRLARLADTAAAWKESLMSLPVRDAEAAAFGAAARGVVLRDRVATAQAAAWAEVLLEILVQPPRPAANGNLPAADQFEGSDVAEVALSPADLVHGPSQLAFERGEPLFEGGAVTQEFRGTAGLRRIDLRFGTYGRRNSHELSVEVRADGDRRLGGRKIRADRLVDHGWVGIDLEENAVTEGTLRVEMRAHGTSGENAVLPWRATLGSDAARHDAARFDAGPLRIDGREVPGECLSLRTFGEPDA